MVVLGGGLFLMSEVPLYADHAVCVRLIVPDGGADLPPEQSLRMG